MTRREVGSVELPGSGTPPEWPADGPVQQLVIGESQQRGYAPSPRYNPIQGEEHGAHER
jgi:hypothetical protein